MVFRKKAAPGKMTWINGTGKSDAGENSTGKYVTKFDVGKSNTKKLV